MRPNRKLAVTDESVVRELIAANPWATIVSSGADGLIASHYPVLLDESTEQIVLATHIGKPDDRLHELDAEVLVIFQGPHGYVSPSWYVPGSSRAPTWNFSAVHCWGTPQILSDEENLDVLVRLTAHFEQHVDEPMWLDRDWAAPVARGTVGLRIPVERFTCKVKMSQDKDPESVQNVIDQLRHPGPYQQTEVADAMERARAESSDPSED